MMAINTVLFVTYICKRKERATIRADPTARKPKVKTELKMQAYEAADVEYRHLMQAVACGKYLLYNNRWFRVAAHFDRIDMQHLESPLVYGDKDGWVVLWDGKSHSKKCRVKLMPKIEGKSKPWLPRTTLVVSRSVMYCLDEIGRFAFISRDFEVHPVTSEQFDLLAVRYNKVVLVALPSTVVVYSKCYYQVVKNKMQLLQSGRVTAVCIDKDHIVLGSCVKQKTSIINSLFLYDRRSLALLFQSNLQADCFSCVQLIAHNLQAMRILIHATPQVLSLYRLNKEHLALLASLKPFADYKYEMYIDMTMLVDRNIVVCNKTSIRCVYRIIL